MTDKELRKLKRADLLEILYYLRKELDELKVENESLKAKIDEMHSVNANNAGLSEELVQEIQRAVKSAIESTRSDKPPNETDPNIRRKGQAKNRKAEKGSGNGKKDQDGMEQ